MEQLNLTEVADYVEKNIGVFHQKRIGSLNKLRLKEVLKRKNPYLFKAKNVRTAEDIVKGLVEAHISSSEEGIFGDWLEGLAIFICGKVFGGWKSGIEGIDLEFDRNGVRYIVNIKSGPNWGNSSQIKKMVDDFQKAIRTLKTSNSGLIVEAVNGCCYGRDNNPFKKGNYYKFCGQQFWEFISGNPLLFVQIIEPLGHKAREKNEEFLDSYGRMINKFTLEFAQNFCTPEGDIDWGKFVRFNSEK